MGLILVILKVILIAFIVVLGFILLLLGLILLVPIRYEVTGGIGDSWEFQIKGKITYLLSMIKMSFFYEKQQFDMKLFLFGFQKKINEDNTSEISKDDGDETNLEQEDIDKNESNSEEQVYFSEKKQGVEDETSVSETVPVKSDISESDELSQTKVKAKKEKKQKVKKKRIKNQENKFNFTFIKQELTDEHNKSVVKKICSELLYMLRHFKFRKLVTDLSFSTGDPAFTGQVFGVLCMIPVLYRYDFKMIPDFETEEFYVKGTFLVEGKVRLIHILIACLRLIFDKEVRLVVKKILTLLEK